MVGSTRATRRPGQRARLAATAAFLGLASVAAALSPASAREESRVYFHGSRSEHVIALTFDDGYPAENCVEIEKILQANGAAATFFPSARWVQRAPDVFKRLAAEYPFGDHTATHPHMKGLSYDRQLEEIDSDRRIVEDITGVPLIKVFRAPYGEFDSTTLAAAAAAGFPVTMQWDINVYDLSGDSDAKLTDQATAGHDGSVITMHCSDAAVRILQTVIDDYRSRGFQFVTVPDLLSGVVPSSASGSGSPQPAAGSAVAGSSSPGGSLPSLADVVGTLLLLGVLVVAGAAVLGRLRSPRRRSPRSPLARL